MSLEPLPLLRTHRGPFLNLVPRQLPPPFIRQFICSNPPFLPCVCRPNQQASQTCLTSLSLTHKKYKSRPILFSRTLLFSPSFPLPSHQYFRLPLPSSSSFSLWLIHHLNRRRKHGDNSPYKKKILKEKKKKICRMCLCFVTCTLPTIYCLQNT